jgi:hypothetical protein
MRNEGGEVHAETDEARGGSTPHIVRWVLVISTLAAIVLLSIVWMTGAALQDEGEEQPATASERIADAEDRSDTDGIVSQEADEFAPETAADVIEGGETDPTRTVEN